MYYKIQKCEQLLQLVLLLLPTEIELPDSRFLHACVCPVVSVFPAISGV